MKRIKWLMLLCALAVMFAVPAWAVVTEVSTSADLKAAIAKAASGDIKLDANIDFTSKDKGSAAAAIEISRDVSIDLNGHNIIATNIRALHVVSGNVTILGEGVISATSADGGAGKSGTNDIFGNSSSVIRVGNEENTTISKTSAKLTIGEGVTVSSDFCYGVSVFGSNDIDASKDTANIEFVLDGTVRVTGEACAVSGNGRGVLSATIITINGTAKSAKETAIYHPGSGTLTINGTVEGIGGIEAKGGETNIDSNVNVGKNAMITAKPNRLYHKKNNNGTSIEGFAIVAVNNPAYKGNVNFNISSGAAIDGYILAISDDEKTLNVPIASIDATHSITSLITSKDLTLYPGLIHITGGAFSKYPKTFEAVSPDVSKDVIYVSKAYAVIPLSNDTYKFGVVASTFKPTLSIDVNDEVSTDYKAVYSADKKLVLTALPTPSNIASVDIGYKYKWTKSEDKTVSADTKVFTLSGTSADSGTYTCEITISEVLSNDKLGKVLGSADATVKVTITEPEPEEEAEAIKLSASSTDVTVYQGESVDITVEATSGDSIVWTKSSGDLPSGVTATSADKTYTIKGIVAASATEGAYTYKVIASNDTSLASVDIKITVKEKKSETDTSGETTTTAAPVLSATATTVSVDLNGTRAITAVTVTATSGDSITWSTSGTYPTGLTTTSADTTFTISGTVSASADVKTYTYTVIATNTAGSDKVTITFYVYTSAGGTTDSKAAAQEAVKDLIADNPDSDDADIYEALANDTTFIANVADNVDTTTNTLDMSVFNGLTTTSGLKAVLDALTAAGTTTSTLTLDFADNTATSVEGLDGVTVAGIDLSSNKTVTSVSLKGATLTGSLSMASNTTVETVDLSGATVAKVEMANSGVDSVTLDAESDVKEIDAKGSALATLELASNTNIQSLDIGGTQVSTLNAAGCTGLTNLAAEGASAGSSTVGDLEELDITSCDNLTSLQVPRNKLLGIAKPSANFSKPGFIFRARGQRRTPSTAITFSRTGMNLFTILRAILNLASGANLPFTVSTTTVTITGGTMTDSGDITFATTTTGFNYEYNPGFTSAGSTGFVVADTEDGMDVTIATSSSTATDEESTLPSSSGGGCDAGFGFGALAALMAVFALKKRR